MLRESLCGRHRETFVASFPPHLPTFPDRGPLVMESAPGPGRLVPGDRSWCILALPALHGGRTWACTQLQGPLLATEPILGAPRHRPEEAQISGRGRDLAWKLVTSQLIQISQRISPALGHGWGWNPIIDEYV